MQRFDPNFVTSSDPNLEENIYKSDLLESDDSGIRRKNNTYECGFRIKLGESTLGFLYFKAHTEKELYSQEDLITKRYMSIGNFIAHSTRVEDAIMMEEISVLKEIIYRFRENEPEIGYIHFTDSKNKVLASSDSSFTDKTYDSDLPETEQSVIKEKNGTYECGFSITIGRTKIGSLYFGVNIGNDK